jgi:SAM-dependent methyltransferase
MTVPAEQLKSCCARFYEEPLLRALLGDALHPGGARATTQLGRRLDLAGTDHVLDVACGPGQTALHLRHTFGCRVTGIDYSLNATAEAHAQGNGHLRVVVGDAECLPFGDAQFDATVMECALCLVPNKRRAAEEMARVLKRGGRIGIADLALDRPFPSQMNTVLAWVSCVAGACTSDGYQHLLRGAGFTDIALEDASWALTDLVEEAGRLSSVWDAAARLGKLPGLAAPPAELQGWLREAQRWLAEGWIRYILLTGRR